MTDTAHFVAVVSAYLNDAECNILSQNGKLAMKEKHDDRYHVHLVVPFESGIVLNAVE